MQKDIILLATRIVMFKYMHTAQTLNCNNMRFMRCRPILDTHTDWTK